jgi:hypothetical protein
MSLVLARRYDDALRSACLAPSLAPGFPHPMRQEARALLLLGRFDECARLDPGPYLALRAICLHSLGRVEEARAIIATQAAAAARTATEMPLNPGGIAARVPCLDRRPGRHHGMAAPLGRLLAHRAVPGPETGTYDRVRDDPAFHADFLRLRHEIRGRIQRTHARAGIDG